MAKVCIVILCGVPGSGKSTLARKLCLDENIHQLQLLHNSSLRCHHVCYDELIPRELEVRMIGKSTDEETFCKWKHQRRKIVQCVEKCIAIISGECKELIKQHDSIEYQNDEFDAEINRFSKELEKATPDGGQHIFVIDDNMYYRSMRYEYFQLARKYTAAFGQVLVTCPLSTALERNRSRAEIVPDHVILNMAEKFEEPRSENSWEKYSFKFNSSEDNHKSLSTILDLIHDALQNPFLPVEEEDDQEKQRSRVLCSANVLHQADQILRRLVANEMLRNKESGCSKQELSVKGKLANQKKCVIYHKLQNGSLLIPQAINESVIDASKNETSHLYKFVKEVFEQDFS